MDGSHLTTRETAPSGGALPTDSTLRGARWWVVRTQRHREAIACAHAARAGLAAYLPMIRQWPRPAVGSEVGPLFPGYVFISASLERRHRIERTPGVRALVTFGGEPASLDDRVIAFLRMREDVDGVVRSVPLATGATLEIVDGPMRGIEAVFEQRLTGRQRVLVLVEILQRQTRVELPEAWIRTR